MYFATPEREPLEVALEQSRLISAEQALDQIARSVYDLIAVLNRRGQIVFANSALLEFTDTESFSSICGKRPGELFNCIHAEETEGGCGTSRSCSLCGVTEAVTLTQKTGEAAVLECIISAREHGREHPCNFLVKTTPFILDREAFVLISFKDISYEKKRLSLERIFFHDILNTASSLRIYLDLLKRNQDQDDPLKYITALEEITGSLIEEIESQKMLVTAENGSLKVQNNLIVSSHLAMEVVQQFRYQEASKEKRVSILPFAESFSFISDEAILRRVLANMIKNALEASLSQSAVSLGFSKEGSEVKFWVKNATSIREEIKSQIFKRYFSTKGENRGLGTYSMKLLTEDYLKGRVWFESSEEDGTVFIISIPDRGIR